MKYLKPVVFASAVVVTGLIAGYLAVLSASKPKVNL